MENLVERLNIALETMEVPAFRRDTSKPENLLWLGRNLVLRNRRHPRFPEACQLLRELLVSLVVAED